ncbi:MAG: Fe-S cluster assembly protein SufD [Chloroflexi bacterium]|nr:Fe-S cluster assembly protein SufD [Chloroflexota bacterium]
MTQTLTRYEQYTTDFDSLGDVEQPAWLRDIRDAAWRRFLDVGLPTARRGNEPYKYTNIAPIAGAELALAVDGAYSFSVGELNAVAPPQGDSPRVVFIDGRFSHTLSSALDGADGVSISSLADAIASGSEVVEEHLTRYTDIEEDGFIALNTAFIDDGALIEIASDASVELPIHLVFVTTDGAQTVSHPRVLFTAGRGSSATIVESYIGVPGNRCLTNSVAEFVLGDDATLEHYRLLMESEDAFHVGVARVQQSAGSTYNSKVFERQVGLGRFDLYTNIDGENSSCDLQGLYFTSGRQHMDNYININHNKPHSSSNLYYKGILDGRSRAVFGGTVYVQRGAIKTESHQEDKNLVLSPDAEVDSKPSLYIWADDVKCGHGATAGNIDRDTVFYMRSRGIDLETASRLLIFGFASEIIDTVEDDDLRDFLERLFLDSLPSYKFEF